MQNLQDWLKNYTQWVHKQSPMVELGVLPELAIQIMDAPAVSVDAGSMDQLANLLRTEVHDSIDQEDLDAWHSIEDPSKRYWLEAMIRSAHMQSLGSRALQQLANDKISISDCTSLIAMYSPWDQLGPCRVMWNFQKYAMNNGKSGMNSNDIQQIFKDYENYMPGPNVNQQTIIQMLDFQRKVDQDVMLKFMNYGLTYEIIATLKLMGIKVPDGDNIDENTRVSRERLLLTAYKFSVLQQAMQYDEMNDLIRSWYYQCELIRMGLWGVEFLNTRVIEPLNGLGMLAIMKKEATSYVQVRREIFSRTASLPLKLKAAIEQII